MLTTHCLRIDQIYVIQKLIFDKEQTINLNDVEDEFNLFVIVNS